MIFFQLEDILACESAIELFVSKNAAFKMIKDFFPKIKEAVKILSHARIVTKTLQKTDCTLSDFYGSFIKMYENIKLYSCKPNKQTNLANCLLIEFGARHDRLFKNEAVLCALYLDRRFALLLKEKEVEFAKKSLYKLYKNAIEIMNIEDPKQSKGCINESSECEFDMESFLIEKGCEPLPIHTDENANDEPSIPKQSFDCNMDENDFFILLEKFEEKYPRIHHSTPILNFWREQCEFPELFILSTIWNSIPPAQASVERCFSILSLVFNCRRCNISLDLLQEILLININRNIVESIFNTDLNILKEKYSVKECEI